MENQQFKGKRVLVVAQHFWPENFRINDIVEGFVESGIEVDVLCGLPNYPKGEWFPGYRYTGPRREKHGGADIFRLALPIANVLDMTEIDESFDADTFFPEFSPEDWQEISRQPQQSESGLAFSFVEYRRR